MVGPQATFQEALAFDRECPECMAELVAVNGYAAAAPPTASAQTPATPPSPPCTAPPTHESPSLKWRYACNLSELERP